MPSLFASNRILGITVIVGLLLSALSLYLNYRKPQTPKVVEKVVEKPYHFEWHGDQPFDYIANHSYENQTVPLDGKSYRFCVFHNVSFLFNGTAPFEFDHNQVTGNHLIRTDNPAVMATAAVAIGFGLPTREGGLLGQMECPWTWNHTISAILSCDRRTSEFFVFEVARCNEFQDCVTE